MDVSNLTYPNLTYPNLTYPNLTLPIGEMEKIGRFFNFEKIITRKILIVEKNFTYKKGVGVCKSD